ncbi:MAG: Cna B-type domain-containing protein [Lachnospiraceae bacterium]
MKKRILSTLLALTLVISMFMQHDVSYVKAAGRDISATNVTSLTVAPTKITDGDRFKITLAFDDTGGKIQDGDTIHIGWTSIGSSPDVYIQGYATTIDLTIQGQVVGQAEITADNGATIKFNSNINPLDKVSGHLEFDATGRNITQVQTENTKTASITSGNQKTDVAITKPAAGTTNTFYHKSGIMDPADTTHVYWYLVINAGKTIAEDKIHIDDQIQPGQTLTLDDFWILIEGANPREYNGAAGIAQFLSDFPGTTLTTDTTKNTILVDIPAKYISSNIFTISYSTLITNPTMAEFSNNTIVSYKEANKEAVINQPFNVQVKNVSAGADITGTVPGELKIQKVIQGTTTPIPGVTFTLTRKDGGEIQGGKTSITLTTDANGLADIKGLPVGNYSVKEATAPNWVDFDPLSAVPIDFTITQGASEGKFQKIENQIKKLSIPVEKKWIGASGTSAVITLFADNVDTKQQLTLNKDNTWKGTFVDLPKYNATTGAEITYTVKEDPINGYTAAITGDAKTGFIVTNTEILPKGTKDTTAPDNKKLVAPITGDISNISLWIAFLFISGGSILFLVKKKKKSNH